jgi:imidazolonepropionase-like amidohydrolase
MCVTVSTKCPPQANFAASYPAFCVDHTPVLRSAPMKAAKIVWLLLAVSLAPATAQQQKIYALKAARVFDSLAGVVIEPGLVIVADGKVQSVSGSAIPSGATVIDLHDATLLPGFIDAHTHLTFDFDPDYEGAQLRGLQRTIAEQAIRSTENARKTLMAGFTTVRDVGSSDFLDVGLRDSINAGVVIGPRMLVAVHSLGSTGGHCDGGAGFRFGALNHETGPRDGVINSADDARYAVRFNIKYGADIIKTCASGGVLSPTDDVDVPQLTQAELNAIVEEAHTLRRKTAAHAHGAEAAKRAIRAGIDSIEHGTFLDDEALRMMHDRGVFLVPTLTTRIGLEQSKFPPRVKAKADAAVKQQDNLVRRAIALGVKIALGTDAAVYPHGRNAEEFMLMAADGMSAAQALQAGTATAAELLGLGDRVGALKPGFLADVVGVRGNPLTDLKTTQTVIFVMKDGVVYKNAAEPAH